MSWQEELIDPAWDRHDRIERRALSVWIGLWLCALTLILWLCIGQELFMGRRHDSISSAVAGTLGHAAFVTGAVTAVQAARLPNIDDYQVRWAGLGIGGILAFFFGLGSLLILLGL